MDFLTANDQQGIYPPSFYADHADFLAPFPKAKGDLSCDICVIGGGYTGLSSALHLAERGYDVVLLEAHRLGWGASGRNGGQVGSGQRLDQNELETIVGKTAAKKHWELSLQSVKIVRDLISKHNINCGYTPGIIHADHRQRFVKDSHRYVQKLRNEYDYEDIAKLGFEEIRNLIGSQSYFGGWLDMGSGHLNPLEFALGLARAARSAGTRIFENSRVQQIRENGTTTIVTDKAHIKARYVILGCNGYLGNLSPPVASRVMPINNYIIATEPLNSSFAEDLIKENYAVADSKFVVNYFRLSADNRMLFGGGETYGYRFPKDIASIATRPMLEVFPQLKNTAIDYAWGGTLAITINRMPYFERLGSNILSASGFSGHGVALATLTGQILADVIEQQSTRFDLMATIPTKRFPGGVGFRWPLLVLAMIWFSIRDRL